MAFEPGFVNWNCHDCASHATIQTKRRSISNLEGFLTVLRSYGVIEAHLFGSSVHGTDRPDSDIDFLVTFAQPTKLFTQIDLADELATLTRRRVDLMTELHPAFAPYIVPTLVFLPL